MPLVFHNSYSQLPLLFYTKQLPAPVSAPHLVVWNSALAQAYGITLVSGENSELTNVFSGNTVDPQAAYLAQAYAGHQFGHFVLLGDGRALLLGEILTPDNRRMDIHLKGSGRTFFSRSGDGRAALGPMLREYILGESMHAFGIPTTRALAVLATGESVYREQVLPGAILVRTAQSHIRFGTFEYACSEGQLSDLQALADYVINRHYPEIASQNSIYLALFEAICIRYATLIAHWMCVGFIHGVMNTDNMSISGETLDYGPCAFMDHYDPDTVFSAIDRMGRYRYSQQPVIAQWNLTRLAETFFPLLTHTGMSEIETQTTLTAALNHFASMYEHHWHTLMCKKLGLSSEHPDSPSMVQTWLALLTRNRADFTNSHRALYAYTTGQPIDAADASFFASDAMRLFLTKRESLRQSALPALENMAAHNPIYIPRNHQVDAVLQSAEKGAMSPLTDLMSVLKNPYVETDIRYTRLPTPAEQVKATFCGT